MSKAGKDDDNLFPIAVLIDELRNDDVQTRLISIKKLPTVALALGMERTRNELIPFLTDTVYDEDEVLLALAEQLGSFVPLVGGSEYAYCLLLPLETLATVEETVVRDKAVDSLRIVAASHSPQDLEKHFVPLIRRLSTGEWFTSRTSACGLFSSCYARLSTSLKTELRRLFRQLATDDTPMVRRAAACRLGELVTVMDLEDIKSDLLLLLPVVVQDEQDSVRLLGIGACVSFCKILPKEDIKTSIVPLIRGGAEDKSWRVRHAVAENILEIEKLSIGDVTQIGLVDIYTALLKDSEAEVKSAAVGKLKEFCETLLKDSRESITVKSFLPIVKEMINDPNIQVKISLAGVLMGLSPIIGKVNTTEHLLPIFLTQLKDENAEVRLNLISKLDCLSEVIGAKQASQNLIPTIIELADDAKWRVRLALMQHIPLLAGLLGPQVFSEDKLTTLCLSWLADPVFAVREAAANNLKTLVDKFGSNWCQQYVLTKIVDMSRSHNYLHRMICLHSIQNLSEVLASDMIQKHFLPILNTLVSDPVPNVRFKTAQTYAKISKKLDTNSQSTIKKALDKMKSDSDNDVVYFSQQAIKGLK